MIKLICGWRRIGVSTIVGIHSLCHRMMIVVVQSSEKKDLGFVKFKVNDSLNCQMYSCDLPRQAPFHNFLQQALKQYPCSVI